MTFFIPSNCFPDGKRMPSVSRQFDNCPIPIGIFHIKTPSFCVDFLVEWCYNRIDHSKFEVDRFLILIWFSTLNPGNCSSWGSLFILSLCHFVTCHRYFLYSFIFAVYRKVICDFFFFLKTYFSSKKEFVTCDSVTHSFIPFVMFK